jgi:adenosylhomocysteine nucleosidase
MRALEDRREDSMTEPIAGNPPLAVVCAMEDELCHLRTALAPGHEEWHAGRRFWLTRLDAYPVVLTCCGIGMLSAAAVTEAVIGRYRPRALLNYGCAGAHRPDLLPGDLVIGERVVAYDSVKLHPDGREREVRMWYLHADRQQRTSALAAAPALVAAAHRAAAAWAEQYDAWPLSAGWPETVPHRRPQVVSGTVASADRWNRAPARIQELAERHTSLCEDMEAAAIALTCASHEVPFLTIKDISNNELVRQTDATFATETVGQLGRRAALLALATIRILIDGMVVPLPGDPHPTTS